jgi:redox-sensitive bicupin YhaK (pirin superfamily)
MNINADFSVPAVRHVDDSGWVPSPSGGVERLMLDRIGGEVARATSLVRYAPGSRFPTHTHGGGEEFFVLDGVFSDENGDYPAGTYVRNPIGSQHAPFSAQGCTIWVKLRQFQPGDTAQIVVKTAAPGPTESPAPAVAHRRDLHDYGREKVYLQSLPAGAHHTVRTETGGAEVLVLDGSAHLAGEALGRWSWWRNPKGKNMGLTAGHEGARLLIKEGHLPVAGPVPPAT